MKYYISLFLFISINSLIAQEFTCLENPDTPSFSEWTIGEFNGDGQLDFLTTSANASNTYYVTQGTDIFNSLEFVEFSSGIFLEDFVQLDFDLDGDTDLLSSAFREERSFLWLNDGQGNFTEGDSISIDYNSGDTADINGDGVEELILAFDETIEIYDLTTSSKITLENNAFVNGRISAAVGVDYNNDGLTDIVASHISDELVAYEQDMDGNFEQVLVHEASFLQFDLDVADLNQDGVQDFISYSSISGSAVIVYSQPNGEYDDVRLDQDGFGTGFQITDFDLDGIPEIFVVEGSNFDKQVSLYQLDRDTFIQTILFEPEGTNISINPGGLEDLDDDGDLDLYLLEDGLFSNRLLFCLQGEVILVDEDGDGFTNDVDCDDTNPDVNPDASEVCDDIDNNCDGRNNENQTFLSWWVDADGDGFGGGPVDSTIVDCRRPDGYVQNNDDCDDINPNINPDADEIPNNGIDEDCDGMDLITSSTYELSGASLQIYPNPSIDKVVIDFSSDMDFKSILYNLNGQIIREDINTHQLNVSELESGIYLLFVSDSNSGGHIVHRFFKS